jgi:uncharacterized protein YdeI (YjbR/CyaY-like superfamily)
MMPTFFVTPEDFRNWFEKNHLTEKELLVGFYTTKSKRPSITWSDSVDQALCFGWIDGVRRNRDAESYTIRFTPRRASSIWCAANIKRVVELEKLGLMTDAGRAAFEMRKEDRSAIYSYENAPRELDEESEKEFKKHPVAWEFFRAQAPSYQRVSIFRVLSAKREETRRGRLAALIEACQNGERRDVLTSRPKRVRT